MCHSGYMDDGQIPRYAVVHATCIEVVTSCWNYNTLQGALLLPYIPGAAWFKGDPPVLAPFSGG